VHQPFVIGHAAAAGEAPANTLAGVRAALAAGCEAMEIDVQPCADGVPVLMHDTTVDRTTNLRGAVRGLPLEALRAADAGGGEPVPTLGEVLELVAGRLTVMCELKADPSQLAPDRVLVEGTLAVIREHDAWPWVALQSFDPAIVQLARELEPRVSAAIISPPVDAAGLDRLIERVLVRGAQAISLEHHCIDAAVVRRVKARQLTLWCWTADAEDDWARLVGAGVDGIITNHPSRLRMWLGARH
jgi:glycerophosphoryl diester phosphodiesterase